MFMLILYISMAHTLVYVCQINIKIKMKVYATIRLCTITSHACACIKGLFLKPTVKTDKCSS